MVAPLLVLTLAQRPTDQYTLGVQGDTFLVRKGARTERIPFAEPAVAGPRTSFRKDDRWAVWDERGLTTRDGDWTYNDRLAAIPVSPRLQSRAEILGVQAKVKAKQRTLTASGLSGARRIGSLVYLLPRWDDALGKSWFEALVVIDLARPNPKARLLGQFEGLSLGQGAADDRLGIEDGLLTVAVNGESGWGTATYDPKRARFAFRPRGYRLMALDDDRIVETTPYGTTLVGRQEEGRTIPWLETRGPAEFVAGTNPVLVRCGDRLRNAVTGAELRIARNAAIRRADGGILVFWPSTTPRSARFVDPDRFEERARWERGTKPAAR